MELRNRHDDLSDKEFRKIIKKSEQETLKYREKMLNPFVAFWIATRYKNNALWDEKFDLQINTALSELAMLTKENVNKKAIKNILKKEYDLIILSENPFKIKRKDEKNE